MMRRLEFWFEFASAYSYLSAMRIDELAESHGVTVTWKPFLLGPIFRSFGWATSPFVIQELKGAYMWRDMERRAARLGLPFRRLDQQAGHAFPQHSVAAARLALLGLERSWGREFCRSVYHAEFAQGLDISNRQMLTPLARHAGAVDEDISLAFGEVNKARLRAQNETAMRLGIFGAPTFIVDDELFWGDDRLEDALMFASDGSA